MVRDNGNYYSQKGIYMTPETRKIKVGSIFTRESSYCFGAS